MGETVDAKARGAVRKGVKIALVVVVTAVAALPLAMLGLSRLPAERAYQQCAEQPDVSKCHDPLTSWLP
ncbi:hypothetical protein ABT288_35455 [Streptomyces sp. NPDC001093]|uniref:Uncharacterized protein n=1 Tax=Streptomyces fodineus TaxID=1904616 RepID=A0A1D7YG14_9ACTN|nr:hypothetical protein [Streptomyces fodineus]AOR34454.1 hypothetical protein BFF78_28430 [Streptomyces fodineus]